MNIVIIDDEQIIANAFYKLIKDKFPNHNIFVFYKSTNVLDFAKNSKIDLLICDIDMPVMDGIELASYLKNQFIHMETIFLTGMDTFDYVYKANKIQDSKYLLKIEDQKIILDNISSSLEKMEINNEHDINHFELKAENEILNLEKENNEIKEVILNDQSNSCIQFNNLFFNFAVFNNELTFDEIKKLYGVFRGFFNLKVGNIVNLSNTEFALFSSEIIAEESFKRVKDIIKNEFDIAINVCVCTNKINDENINKIYKRSLNILNIYDLNIGNYIIYEDIIKNELDDSHKLIVLIKDYIYQNTDKDISLKRISNLVHYNESYLSRFFKKNTGKNFKDFVTEIKVEKAKNLLASSDMQVKEISKNLGFESTSHFQYFFKKNIGCTPLEYRHNNIGFNSK